MKRPSHATIVAYLALFTALGGSAYAAATIGSAQIKNNSIHSRDVRNNTLTSRDINERNLRSAPRLYTKSVRVGFPPVGNRAVAIALCERGDVAVSGATFGAVGNVRLVNDGPPQAKLVGWSADFEKSAPGPTGDVGVAVVCARKAPR